MKNKIWIIAGLPTSGKSTLLSELAKNKTLKQFSFVDLDKSIEDSLSGTSNSSIKEFMLNFGVAEFRKLEALTLFNKIEGIIEQGQSAIIALGGGGLTWNTLMGLGQYEQVELVHLDVAWDEALERLKILKDRPLSQLLSEAQMAELFRQRQIILRSIEKIIDSRLKIEQQVEEFIKFIKN